MIKKKSFSDQEIYVFVNLQEEFMEVMFNFDANDDFETIYLNGFQANYYTTYKIIGIMYPTLIDILM